MSKLKVSVQSILFDVFCVNAVYVSIESSLESLFQGEAMFWDEGVPLYEVAGELKEYRIVHGDKSELGGAGSGLCITTEQKGKIESVSSLSVPLALLLKHREMTALCVSVQQ